MKPARTFLGLTRNDWLLLAGLLVATAVTWVAPEPRDATVYQTTQR